MVNGKFCIIVPTFNNAGTIRDVLLRTKQQCPDVIVVDDGCTDQTPLILAGIEGITVVRLEKNSGKGCALKHGFRKALEMGFSYAITLDADGQHFPEDIPLLLEACKKWPGSLIVGSRKDLSSQERSGGSKFANHFSNFWFWVQTWRFLPDTQTGYRLYPLRKLHGLSLLTSRYEAELELLVFSAWHGVSLHSVPVNVYYPPRSERVSHFRPLLDFTRISILNTVLCLLAGVYGLPCYLFRFLRTAFYTVFSLLFFLFVSTFILTPYCMLRPKSVHNVLYRVSRFIIHHIPGVHFTLEQPLNHHGTTISQPSVLICNHQSHLDLPALLSLNPKIVVLTNDWVWNNPFYGYMIHKAEFLPVSRGYEAIMPQLRDLASRGYSIAVYPEGTRSVDCSIQRFHQGAFLIARELQLPIVPLVIYGAGFVLPKKGKYLRRGTIALDVDSPVLPEQLAVLGTLRQRASWFRRYYNIRYSEMQDRFS